MCLKGSVDYAKLIKIKIARYYGTHDTVRSDYTENFKESSSPELTGQANLVQIIPM
jgi:hypothetical protein